MFKKSFFLILLIFSNIIYTEDTEQKGNSNSCEEKFNKEFCRSQKIAKTISIIIGSVLAVLFVCLIICMIYKRNSFTSNDDNSNVGIALFMINNLVQNQNDEEIKLKKKIYIFKNIMKPIQYNIKEHEKYGTQCMICLDNFNQNKKICLTNCKHVFHYKCLYDYIINTDDTHCPDCKFDFFTLIENESIDYSKINIESNRNTSENNIENNNQILNINNMNDINNNNININNSENNYNNNISSEESNNNNNNSNQIDTNRLNSNTSRNMNTNCILLNQNTHEDKFNNEDNKIENENNFELKNKIKKKSLNTENTNNETFVNTDIIYNNERNTESNGNIDNRKKIKMRYENQNIKEEENDEN